VFSQPCAPCTTYSLGNPEQNRSSTQVYIGSLKPTPDLLIKSMNRQSGSKHQHSEYNSPAKLVDGPNDLALVESPKISTPSPQKHDTGSFRNVYTSADSLTPERPAPTRRQSLRSHPRRGNKKSNNPQSTNGEFAFRFHCNKCPKSFGRNADLRRHYKKHFLAERRFECLIDACERRGEHGFYRRDKLKDHQNNVHDQGQR
jgi:hypothetical protein